MHNSAGETTGIRHCDVFLLPIFVHSNKGWPVVVRGTARAPAQNRPELCVGQAESKPGQGERRAPPLCGHGNRPARSGCAGRGALAPNPAETAPSARTLPLLYNKRAAGASKRRNRQAKPSAPEPPGRTVLPSPPPPALEKNLPAPLDNATTPCYTNKVPSRENFISRGRADGSSSGS